jgi:DNA excision repair protein ERCC-4
VSRRRVDRSDTVHWPWPVRVPPKGIEDCLPGLQSYFGREVPENKSKQVEVLLWCADWIDAQGRGLRLLHEYKPSFIVMYNADLAFMRQVEVFRSASPGHPVRLYLLAYDDSIDEDRYRNVVEKERFAFKSLIRERATMVVHTDQDGRMAKVDDDPSSAIAPSRVGRRGLGSDRDSRLTDAEKMKNGSTIVVDTRELRSALPMMLFEAGITIVPVTLEVGDFVLSKHVAIERKSVPDLYGSFSSGRLFNQAEALCRHYREACLMIEFESDARLSLAATSGGIPSELVPASIISKIVLLLHQFPSLHLIWCKGPQDTAELFGTLKLSEEEPDVAAATSMGVDCAESIDATHNSGPAALLRSLPGIDGNNINSVMRNVKNVSALFTMTVAELRDVLGSSSKAQLLYDFVNEEPCEALAAL